MIFGLLLSLNTLPIHSPVHVSVVGGRAYALWDSLDVYDVESGRLVKPLSVGKMFIRGDVDGKSKYLLYEDKVFRFNESGYESLSIDPEFKKLVEDWSPVNMTEDGSSLVVWKPLSDALTFYDLADLKIMKETMLYPAMCEYGDDMVGFVPGKHLYPVYPGSRGEFHELEFVKSDRSRLSLYELTGYGVLSLWSDRNDNLYFAGFRDQAKLGVFRIDLASGRVLSDYQFDVPGIGVHLSGMSWSEYQGTVRLTTYTAHYARPSEFVCYEMGESRPMIASHIPSYDFSIFVEWIDGSRCAIVTSKAYGIYEVGSSEIRWKYWSR